MRRLIRDLGKYRASQGKGQLAPKVRDQEKAAKRKQLPAGVKRKRGSN